MKPEDKQKISSFLYPNKTSKDVKKAESDSKTFNPHLAVCSADNGPANNRTQPLILKTKNIEINSPDYTELNKAFNLFLQDPEVVDDLFNQIVSEDKGYEHLISILNNKYLKH